MVLLRPLQLLLRQTTGNVLYQITYCVTLMCNRYQKTSSVNGKQWIKAVVGYSSANNRTLSVTQSKERPVSNSFFFFLARTKNEETSFKNIYTARIFSPIKFDNNISFWCPYFVRQPDNKIHRHFQR